jgi:hypothetical protein
MTAGRKSQSDSVRRAPAIRQLLSAAPENEVDFYLFLREAFLALGGTRERAVREAADWVPALFAGNEEILRVLFSARSKTGGPGKKKRARMRLVFPVTPSLLASVEETAELRPATCRKLATAGRGRSPAQFSLPVAGDDDLAEGLALALLIQARA